MPCMNDSYPEATDQQVHNRNTAARLRFALLSLDEKVPGWVDLAIQTEFCNEERSAPKLCALIKKMPEKVLDRVVYDGRNPESRLLADWWEKHQEADAKRKAEEDREKKHKKLVNSAIAKLTGEEVGALGLEKFKQKAPKK